MIKKLIFFSIILFTLVINVNADSYSTNNNLFENSYSNNLIDMANSQIKNFIDTDYIIFQIDNNYYLISGTLNNVTDNVVYLDNTSIIKAERVQENYNYYYNYSSFSETSSSVSVNNVVISNISINKAITGKRFNEYEFNKHMTSIGILLIGIVFAIFLTKERKSL